jgi:hypothetical protein
MRIELAAYMRRSYLRSTKTVGDTHSADSSTSHGRQPRLRSKAPDVCDLHVCFPSISKQLRRCERVMIEFMIR